MHHPVGLLSFGSPSSIEHKGLLHAHENSSPLKDLLIFSRGFPKAGFGGSVGPRAGGVFPVPLVEEVPFFLSHLCPACEKKKAGELNTPKLGVQEARIKENEKVSSPGRSHGSHLFRSTSPMALAEKPWLTTLAPAATRRWPLPAALPCYLLYFLYCRPPLHTAGPLPVKHHNDAATLLLHTRWALLMMSLPPPLIVIALLTFFPCVQLRPLPLPNCLYHQRCPLATSVAPCYYHPPRLPHLLPSLPAAHSVVVPCHSPRHPLLLHHRLPVAFPPHHLSVAPNLALLCHQRSPSRTLFLIFLPSPTLVTAVVFSNPLLPVAIHRCYLLPDAIVSSIAPLLLLSSAPQPLPLANLSNHSKRCHPLLPCLPLLPSSSSIVAVAAPSFVFVNCQQRSLVDQLRPATI
ncbi:hypothetical protein BHM03_00023208 [Ensete ventricosum]|nr:hypothetical protein BHM03_00023208 [Ensete ventricosum]